MKKKGNQNENRNQEVFCVGIGASAGGLEAIETFFKHMPKNPDMAFVIVQHLSPDYKSLMGELLQRFTNMPISRVEDGMLIEPNHIYLIPPRKNMTAFAGRLYLTEQSLKQTPNLPIDIFFRSLAQDMGKHAIGVILSGTGSDGTLGIKAIKEMGGMIMVQDENTAKFDGMPRSSIATGMVDYILPPDQMAKTLLKYIKHPFIGKNEKTPKDLSSDESLLRILRIVRDRVGVDFTFYKPNTILRRLEKRLGINQIESFEEYLDFLEHSPKEAQILYKDLLIGVTQFFRDKEAFDLLYHKLIKILLKKREDEMPVRIWCVGCSTGEEAYSIAILISEFMEDYKKNFDVKLFATDLDKEHIEQASNGTYPDSIATDVSPERLEKYFVKTPNGYQVKESIRRMVIYAQQNIIKDPPFSKIDLITCRNMLIYLNTEMQRKILSMFYYSLMPGGGLFLGSSETLGEMSEGFEVLSNKWKIYRQRAGYKPPFITNYMLPLTKQQPKTRYNQQDFNYLQTENKAIPDNVISDLLEVIMPPSVIVNSEFQVIHLFKDVNEYIKLPSGKASLDILSMVRKELAVVLSSMLNKVVKDEKEVFFKDVQLKEEKHTVNITAKPLKDKASQKTFIVVSFEKVTEKKEAKFKEKEKFDIKSEISQRYSELEKELQFTKENLQATIEELETSNEELQSTNEELVASNEELQSTNEELQSVNEELYTVNSEYQKKIEELTQLNNDMNNLLRNTNIGILYLDRKLRIRKYTKLITRIINVMDMDLGRPIKHISKNVNYQDFEKDVIEVRDNLQIKEVELQDDEGRWNLIRIQPYRTSENAVDGITVTVIDISNLVETERKYKNLFDTMAQGVVYQDAEGKIFSANPAAEDILGLSLDQMMGRTSIDKRWHTIYENGEPFPGEKHPAMIALKTGKKVKKQIMGVYHPQEDKHRWISVNATPKFQSGEKQPYQVYATFEDITAQKEKEAEIKRNNDLLYRIMENSPIGKLVVDIEGQITFANKLAEKIMGVKRKSIINRKYNDVKWKISDLDGKKIPNDKLPFSLILQNKDEIRNYCLLTEDDKGEKRYLNIHGSPMFDENGEVDGVVFSLEEITKTEAKRKKGWKDF